MARQPQSRDYRTEEVDRNARARARGFANRYQERKARAAGQIPTARELDAALKADPKAARRAGELGRARAAGFDTYSQYRAARADAQRWSDAHSRQPVSLYTSRMGPLEFRDYWNALVRPWNERRTGTDKEWLRKFIVHTKHHLTEEEYDDSPRY